MGAHHNSDLFIATKLGSLDEFDLVLQLESSGLLLLPVQEYTPLLVCVLGSVCSVLCSTILEDLLK
jgi:hypothetical protein